MFERPYLKRLEGRIIGPRQFIQVVTGPRQVGKTTMVQQLLKRYPYASVSVSADAIGSGQAVWLEQQWEIARTRWRQSGALEVLLVIDEIQKVDNWSEVVKKCWDADSRNEVPVKVILLGSSRLLIQKGQTESLAGRLETTYMGHWSLEEMESAFGWQPDQYVWFGGYPGSAVLVSDEERWKNYVRDALIEPSISRDILMMTRVDKPALMRRLFETACLYSGQILSYTKMLGQLTDAGNTTTLSHYISLLSSAGLVGGLEKYSKTEIRKRSSSPKFQVFNNALLSAQSKMNFSEAKANPAVWGRWVESAIGAHLLNLAAGGELNLFYWREGQLEVDFVLSQRKLIALEVKSGKPQSTAGMAVFQKNFQPEKMLLIGGDGIPWTSFLRMNTEAMMA